MDLDLRNSSRDESGDDTPFFLRLPEALSPHEGGDTLVSPSSTRDLLIGEDFVVTSLRSSRNGDHGEANENEFLLKTPESLAYQMGRLSVTPLAGRKLGGELNSMTYPTATLSPPTFESLSVSSKNSRPPRIPNIRLRLSGEATTMSAPLPRAQSPSNNQQLLHPSPAAAGPAPPLPVHLHRRGRSVSDASVLSALTDGSSDYPPIPSQRGRRVGASPSWNPPGEGTHTNPDEVPRQTSAADRPIFGGMDINVPISLQQPILTDMEDMATFEDIEPLSAPTPRTALASPSTTGKKSTDTGDADRRRSVMSHATRFEVEAESLISKAMAELHQDDRTANIRTGQSVCSESLRDVWKPDFSKLKERRSSSLHGWFSIWCMTGLVLLFRFGHNVNEAEPVSWRAFLFTVALAVFTVYAVFFSLDGLALLLFRLPCNAGDVVVLTAPDENVCLEDSRAWIVERTGLFATTLRHCDTRVVATIPNQSLASQRILNLSRSGPAQVAVYLPLSLDTPHSKVLVSLMWVRCHSNFSFCLTICLSNRIGFFRS